jgi:hypothetical protein
VVQIRIRFRFIISLSPDLDTAKYLDPDPDLVIQIQNAGYHYQHIKITDTVTVRYVKRCFFKKAAQLVKSDKCKQPRNTCFYGMVLTTRMTCDSMTTPVRLWSATCIFAKNQSVTTALPTIQYTVYGK